MTFNKRMELAQKLLEKLYEQHGKYVIKRRLWRIANGLIRTGYHSGRNQRVMASMESRARVIYAKVKERFGLKESKLGGYE